MPIFGSKPFLYKKGFSKEICFFKVFDIEDEILF